MPSINSKLKLKTFFFESMTPLILLHGAIGASDQLQALASVLQQKGREVHVMDFAGHGKQPFGEAFGIDYFGWELKRFVKEKDLVKPNVFGYSMGGYVALHLASKEP